MLHSPLLLGRRLRFFRLLSINLRLHLFQQGVLEIWVHGGDVEAMLQERLIIIDDPRQDRPRSRLFTLLKEPSVRVLKCTTHDEDLE